MAVFRVERTRDYTVMSNYHLRDKNLSLKAKGLLSQMLSLPEDWDYTLAGLSYINRESKDAIRSAVNELEKAGYVQRRQTTDANGKFSVNEYIIHECPVTPAPSLEKPLSENPTTDNPSTGKPLSENPTQINTKKTRKEKQNTDRANTDSIPSFREPIPAEPSEANRSEGVSEREYEDYRELICQNIDYDILVAQNPFDTAIDISSVTTDLETRLMDMDLGPLFGLWFQSLFVGVTMWALSICIFVITYGRMIEIYLVTSVAPIPMATMTSRESGQMGQNYLRSLFALGFQGFLIIVCVGIYAVLVQNIAVETDIIAAIWGCMGYTVLLCFTLFKTGSLAKSVFNAH